eukprot:5712818-Pyramimonas_sp.AAC.1
MSLQCPLSIIATASLRGGHDAACYCSRDEPFESFEELRRHLVTHVPAPCTADVQAYRRAPRGSGQVTLRGSRRTR